MRETIQPRIARFDEQGGGDGEPEGVEQGNPRDPPRWNRLHHARLLIPAARRATMIVSIVWTSAATLTRTSSPATWRMWASVTQRRPSCAPACAPAQDVCRGA